MIIDVAFNYEATVRRRRKRGDEDAVYRDSVPVHVAEPAASEAPVALRVSDPDDYSAKTRRMIEMRWYDDRLWRAMEEPGRAGGPGTPRDAAWLSAVCARPNQQGNPLTAGADPRHPDTKRIEDDVSVVRVPESVRDEVAAQVTALAQGVMLLDGLLWRSVPEPRLALDRSDGSVCIRMEWCDDDTPFDVYRLDEGDLIGPTNPETFPDGQAPDLPAFEVLIPECLRLRTTEAAVAHAAREMLGDMRGHLADNEVDFFLAFNGLKKANAAFEPTVEDPVRPDMTEILGALGDAVEANKSRLARSWHKQVFVDRGIASALARVEILGLDAEALAGIAP